MQEFRRCKCQKGQKTEEGESGANPGCKLCRGKGGVRRKKRRRK